MFCRARHSFLASSAILASCFIMLNSGISFAATQDVGSGETVSDQIISITDPYDTLNVNDAGTANSTTVNNGGTINVNNGGTANDTTINAGGIANIDTNGIANNVTVNGGIVSTANNGGTINGLTVEEGGQFDFSTDATVTDATIEGQAGSIDSKTAQNILINNGSKLDVNNAGTANNTTVDDGGKLNVNGGGTANTTTVKEGGLISATESGATVNDVTLEDGGNFDFSTDATVTNMKDGNGASLGTIGSKQAQNVIINEGSTLTVNTDGSASGTQVSGGTLNVTGGGTATNTTINNSGDMTVDNQGTADGVTVTGSGSITVGGMGTVDHATLTGTDDTNKATITVENQGKANNTTLNANSEMTVSAGGTADTTTVGSNATITVDGTATNTTVNSGGTIEATQSGAKVDNVTIANGGTFDFSTDATVTNATLDGEALGSIENKVAQDVTVNNGSNLTVSSGGTAKDTIVQDGGTITAKDANAKIEGITMESGSKFDLSTSATVTGIVNETGGSMGSIENNIAENIVVREGSTLTATNGGTIQNAGAVGGTIVVETGGQATQTTIGDGGTIKATEGGAIVDNVFISDTGNFDFSTDATVSNTTYGSQNITIENKTVADVDIKSGSKLSVNDAGTSENITVSGGSLAVNNGGTANSTTVSGGEMQITGGSAIDTTVINTGVVNATGGGRLNTTHVADGGTINLSENAEADLTTIGNGGTVNVETTGIATNTTIDNGGVLNVKENGWANNSTVENGGTVNVAANGTLGGISVKSGGTLTTSATGRVNDLNAGGGSTINIAAGTTLGGSITMDAWANASGSTLDFSGIFSADNNLVNSLTLTNGVNAVFNGKLINQNTSENKALILDSGNYTFSDSGQNGTVQVGGWNTIDLSNSTVRLESDIAMNGSEKNLTIYDSAILDVSGTLENVLNVTLDGNVINNGTIDFTTQGNNAADEFTITGDYTGAQGSTLIFDINPADGSSDKLIVGGNVYGNTNVYLKSLSARVPENNILFAEAANNTAGGADAFNIWRVEGSPFTWETLFEDNKWYGYVTDGDRPGIVPETAAYYGLIDNTFMQTASLGANLRKNIAESELRKVPCRTANNSKYTNRICRSSRPVFTGWAAPVYSSATLKSPYNYTASISGLDGGLDLISDGYAKFGILASYRNGIYKYEDSGTNYTLKGEAETRINSYLAGAYIRIDDERWSVLLAGYAGMLDADISSEDGVSADTSGTTYGATLDVNYIYQNIDGIRIEPGVRISYTSVKMDEVEDNAGKRQEFDNASRTEVEAGIKFARRWEFPDAKAEIYVKPALVQTLNDGSTFELIEGRELDSTEDRTLAKIEAGMSFDMIGNWSASIAGSYSFGSDYNNTTAGLSLIYNF